MDIYLQFQLYYGDDIPKLQLWFKEKEKLTKKTKRKPKSKPTTDNTGDTVAEDDSEKSAKNKVEGDDDENDRATKSDEKEKTNVEDEEDKEDDEANDENDENDGEEEDMPLRKVPRRRDFFTICKDNGLGALVKKFGLTPEQFAENLRDNYQRHEPGQVAEEPEELAEQYICKYVCSFAALSIFSLLFTLTL